MLSLSIKISKSTAKPQATGCRKDVTLSAKPCSPLAKLMAILYRDRADDTTYGGQITNSSILAVTLEKDDLKTIMVAPRYPAGCYVQKAISDEDELRAYLVVYEALISHSVLDVRGNLRFGLTSFVVQEGNQKSLLALLHAAFMAELRRMLDEDGDACNKVSKLAHPLLSIPTDAVSLVADRALVSVPSSPSLEQLSLSSDEVSELSLTSNPRRLSAGDFKFIQCLGRGGSGSVYRAVHRTVRCDLAIKVIPKEGQSAKGASSVMQERDIGALLSDAIRLAGLCAAWHDVDYVYLAMQRYPTDLEEVMSTYGTPEPDRARLYAAEIFIAIDELHCLGVIHRDIKPANLLIDWEGHIVLADFGICKDFRVIPTHNEQVFQPYYPFLRTDDPTLEVRDPEELEFVVLGECCGTELEMAPEVHFGEPYSFGIDLYSAGVVVNQLICGRAPWDFTDAEWEILNGLNGEDRNLEIGHKKYEPLCFGDVEIDDRAEDFLKKMLAMDPKDRIREDLIPTHPYFADLDWVAVKERRVPAAWVPGADYSVQQASHSVFTPGRSYSDTNPDPFPEFNFVSESALHAAAAASEDNASEIYDLYSDSDSDVDFEGVTFFRRSGGYDISVHNAVISSSIASSDSDSRDGCMLTPTSLPTDLDYHIADEWDVSLITPPSSNPCGPGPKRWFGAHDLRKLVDAQPTLSPSPPFLPAAPTSPEGATLIKSLFDGSSPVITQLYKNTPPPSPDLATSQPEPATASITGILVKVKLWVSKIWSLRSPRVLV